ncbi:PREDICTED: piggyBac transposable element-derived protein 4-like [Nicrophorus vespilloides]|uniref:PiggyBac transposable element-derived protein 4-like n=1 Tax=Nicrophorus vespilloides TaxID=110193 RepID=A0ABM1MTV0_NICVS|nr:PREDICTED: piggyBac transposable element-derived protein 4-like [Nicrophorus vespilloides]
MPKRSRDDICDDSDSSDDEFYLESDTIDDDEYISNSGNISNDGEYREVKVELDEVRVKNENVDIDNVWRNLIIQDENTRNIDFTSGSRMPGPQISTNCAEPIDFFKLFFTDELINKLVEETNGYANEKIAEKHLSKHSIWLKWTDVTTKEMSAFLGVVLNMGTITLSNLKEYWSTENNSRIPYFAEVFRRDRFLQIFWMLQVNRNARHATSRKQKISYYLEYIDNKCRENFVSGKQLSVDEAVVKYNGRMTFIKYNPKKPTKCGIRMYVLLDANVGYIQSILPYFGSLTTEILVRPDLPISRRIILQLYENFLQSNPEAAGYHIYTDRLRYVTKLGTCGTSTRKTFNRRTQEGEIVNINQPNVVINHNKYMDGVDKADHCVSTYCFMRKSQKWWRKLFFWGLEICAINSYILYKVTQQREDKKPMAHLKFVRRLVDQLVEDFRDGSINKPSTSGTAERLNGLLHLIRRNDEGKSKDCVVCSNRKIKGGRRESLYYCNTCAAKPALHIGDCFEKYHTMYEYKTINVIKFE